MRRFFNIQCAPLEAHCPALRHRFQQRNTVQPLRVEGIPLLEIGRIADQQQVGEKYRHLFIVYGVAANRMAGRKHEAITFVLNLRPHHPRGIHKAVADIDIAAHLAFRHRRFVADR